MTGPLILRRSPRRRLTRRDLLRAAAASAGALVPLVYGTGCSGTKTPTFEDYPFSLGVASGEPEPDGMVLWTRLAPRPLEEGGMPPENVAVSWEIAGDEGFQTIAASGEAVARPELAHSVHIEVEGLEPGRWYFYRFHAGSETSPTGRTRTAPRPDQLPDSLRFAFASCQHYETGYYTAYEHMARADLDLVVHLGDYIYEGGAADGRPRRHNSPEIYTLADYRNRHALYKSDPDLQAAHHACPWLVTWDDHEVDNNYANDISEEEDVSPEELLARRAHAYQAYYENLPLRLFSKPQGPDMQLYRRVGFGRLADFQVLDTRQYRTDQPCGDGNKPPCGGVFDEQATMLGGKQERWLFDNLRASEAGWNILAQQVMVARADRNPEDEARWSMDQWAGYDAARKRLLSFIADNGIRNPVVLTGDIHSNWVNDLKVDFDREEDPAVAAEFVGTSISSGGDGGMREDYAEAMRRKNHFVKFYTAERGYVECAVTPKEWRADYQAVEYVSRKGAPLVTRASFVVEDGQPGAKRA